MNYYVNCQIIVVTVRRITSPFHVPVQTGTTVTLLQGGVRNGPLQLLPRQARRQRRLQNVLAALFLQLDLLASSPYDVHESEFRHRQEDENCDPEEPDLTGLDVRHFRQIFALR